MTRVMLPGHFSLLPADRPPSDGAPVTALTDLMPTWMVIGGIGNRTHGRLDTPGIDEIDTALGQPHATGLKVMYSEPDINLLPNTPRGRQRQPQPAFRAVVEMPRKAK